MTNKLKFLTKVSLNKKIKTKWFLIANLIFAILIIGLLNIDFVIKLFGGDFDKPQEIIVIDNIDCFDEFKVTYENGGKYFDDYITTNITLYKDSYESGVELVREDDKILLIIDYDDSNYVKAKIVTNEDLGTITNTLISSTLNNIRSKRVLIENNISLNVYQEINNVVNVEKEILESENLNNNLAAVTIMQIVTMPLFILIVLFSSLTSAPII